MTFRTFNNILEGQLKEWEKEDLLYKQNLEHHREMIITILSPHMKEADRKKSMSQLYPLPWEPEYKRLQKQNTKPKQEPPKTKEDLNKLFGGEMK